MLKTVGIFSILLSLLMSSNITNAQVLIPSKGTEKIISLNGIWKFKYIASSNIGNDSLFFDPKTDVSHWAGIKTPGHWELQGFAEPFYGNELKEGTGLYRTAFAVPSAWNGRPIYIAFDGVQYGYTLWVNGKYAGSFASSFNRQTFDISRFVEAGKSATLAVRVTTRSKGWEFDTNDCWSLSGIIRDVNLFSLPKTHIKDLTVQTNVGKTDATLSVSALIEKVTGNAYPANINVSAKLIDPDGKLVKTFALTKGISGNDTSVFAQHIKLQAPKLWTAETPDLYTLHIELKSSNAVLQQYDQKVGIREVTWNDGVLKLNGHPIKLRGVDHHDLSPVNGRAITEAEMKLDLKLIQEANINFIRTSHYPPQPRLIELCDSLGIYVMEEVPFGYGDEHLNDVAYLPILKHRARATVWRDKNHPSIIVWSVGNENPLTKMCLETGEYVKELDPTRPHCFPQRGSTFKDISKKPIPESVDILTPHYTTPSDLREYSNKFDRPMIVTEYAHALGLDFDKVESLWEIMYANPKLAGGAVWCFFDQGLLRKSTQKTIPGTFTTSVWKDAVTVYDNHGNQGADGLVYANRIPQVDYWQVRKVYTPVKPIDDTLRVLPGKQTVQLHIINRYDFTNLSKIAGKWTLYADTTALQTGGLTMACAPHDTLTASIALNIPQNLNASYFYLKVQFADKHNYTFYEKVYPVFIRNQVNVIAQKLASASSKPVLANNTISFGSFRLGLNSQTGLIQLTDTQGSTLIAEGPYSRVGRKVTMSELATDKKSLPDNYPTGNPHLLTNPVAKIESMANDQIVVHYTYERQDHKGQFIDGTITYDISDSGRIDVHYNFIPKDAKGIALEAGLSFLIPASFTEFHWAGKGLYPAFPGKDRLDEFGLYHLNSRDINYQGNREDVDVAVLSNSDGKGIAIIADKANIAVENTAQGIVISHNAYVSGRYNKGNEPEKRVNFENLKKIAGNFSIVPLNGNWPETLRKLFGSPTQVVTPFKPFYNSYDQ